VIKVDGLHILIQNKTMKPLAIVLNGEEEADVERWGNDPTNVHCKPIQNCHNQSSMYNEYILI
jgi:hypothetical protein